MLAELARRGMTPLPWRRPDYDLDDPAAARRLAERDRPDIVIHCAAWVDVEGCAREPAVAERRNAVATSELASALAERDGALVLISTNEVFDGRRTDGRGYLETDDPRPGNAYGASKLAGEHAALEAFGGRPLLTIVRTAWLFGPAGADFPSKIVAAADRAPDEPLKVVDDEIGSPTSTPHLARVVVDLAMSGHAGTRHLVGPESLSRFAWAEDVLRRVRPAKLIEPVRGESLDRRSVPPPWGVLASQDPALGAALPAWSAAADDYVASVLGQSNATRA